LARCRFADPAHINMSCLGKLLCRHLVFVFQECSLLCDDYARLGYDRFLMDPSIRVVGGG
jgi:hypothetical protein